MVVGEKRLPKLPFRQWTTFAFLSRARSSHHSSRCNANWQLGDTCIAVNVGARLMMRCDHMVSSLAKPYAPALA